MYFLLSIVLVGFLDSSFHLRLHTSMPRGLKLLLRSCPLVNPTRLKFPGFVTCLYAGDEVCNLRYVLTILGTSLIVSTISR
jgi:hypothetical protein